MPRSRANGLGVRGVRIGHATDPDRTTGVTAVVFDAPAATVIDVRGGASGTYDTASLSLEATFGRRWGLFVSGGSLFGLDAARGVRTVLLDAGAGSTAFGNRRPLVPISGAVIFDLTGEDRPLPDYAELGASAARNAARTTVAHGRVGAGAGATVGKYLGRASSMPGGFGSSARAIGSGRNVAVLVVLNAAGAIRDPASGRWVAGARGPRGRLVPPSDLPTRRFAGRGTTVSVVVTDVGLDRPQLARVAAIVHAGLARTIVPYLTSVDGDLVFAASTAERTAVVEEPRPGSTADLVGRLGADAAVDAVLAAVRR